MHEERDPMTGLAPRVVSARVVRRCAPRRRPGTRGARIAARDRRTTDHRDYQLAVSQARTVRHHSCTSSFAEEMTMNELTTIELLSLSTVSGGQQTPIPSGP